MSNQYFSFCPKLKNIIESGKTEDRDGNPLPVQAMSTVNNLHVLREYLLNNHAKDTLEIGLAYGGSAMTILSTLKEIYPDSEFSHSAIDPMQNTTWKGSSLRVIKEIGLNPHFIFHEGFSSLVLPKLIEHGKKYDLIYIDGSHIFEDVFVDFYFSATLLRVGGVLLLDDSTDPHVKKVNRFVTRNYAKILKPFEIEVYQQPQKSLLKRLANKFGFRQLTAYKKADETPRKWNSKYSNF